MFRNDVTREMISGEYGAGNAMFEILFIILVSFIFGWMARLLWERFFLNEKNEIRELIETKGLKKFPAKKEAESNFIKIEKKSEEEKKELEKEIKRIKQGDEEVIVVKDKVSPARVFVSPTGIRNDDLKIVEGIGPKIEGLLKRAGIENWKDLSEKSAEQLREILKNAGDRYSFHDPSTWPEQAMLAYENKWDELEEFQNFLSGGKRV